MIPTSIPTKAKIKKDILDGCHVNVKGGKYQATPIMYAIDNGRDIEIVKLLLKHGADPRIKNIMGKNALFYAFDRHNFEIFKLVADSITNQDEDFYQDMNILMYACFWYKNQESDSKIMKYLLETKKININAKNNKGKTALDYAIKNGDKELINLIKDAMEKQKQTSAIPKLSVKENITTYDLTLDNTNEIILNK